MKLFDGIEIAEADIQRFFQSVKEQTTDLGFWDSRSTTVKSDDKFVLPNGIRLSHELGLKWIEFNNKA